MIPVNSSSLGSKSVHRKCSHLLCRVTWKRPINIDRKYAQIAYASRGTFSLNRFVGLLIDKALTPCVPGHYTPRLQIEYGRILFKYVYPNNEIRDGEISYPSSFKFITIRFRNDIGPHQRIGLAGSLLFFIFARRRCCDLVLFKLYLGIIC